MEIDRELTAAASAPAVLAALAEGEGHGFAILRRVRERSGAGAEWPDGMLYPVLHRLERLGEVEASWELAPGGRRRKRYRITPRGRARAARLAAPSSDHRTSWS